MDVQKSPTIGKLAAALARAQGAMDYAKKDATNPFLKNKYADLASVTDAIKKPLSDNELSYVQPIAPSTDGYIHVLTVLMHSSDEWIASEITMPEGEAPKGLSAAQGRGILITYARRYGLTAMVGIVQDDDDGNTAGTRGASTPRAAARPVATPEQKAHHVDQYKNEPAGVSYCRGLALRLAYKSLHECCEKQSVNYDELYASEKLQRDLSKYLKGELLAHTQAFETPTTGEEK
jgi:hypothetical protein